MANTIELSRADIREEFKSAGVILPGMLIAKDSAGTVSPHAVAGGITAPFFAVEDVLQGRTLDDAYASGEIVFAGVFDGGDNLLALIQDGQTASLNDPLTSAGDGTLKVAGEDDHVLAIAGEAKTASGEDVLTRVTII